MACVICGSTQNTLRARFHHVAYYKCHGCGVVYQSPMPSATAIEEIYGQDNDGYFVSDTKNANHIEGEAWLRETARFFISLLAQQLGLHGADAWKAYNVLDFGCGTGILLSELHKQGAVVAGVEMSPWACEYGRTHFGLTMHNEDILTVDLPPQHFDVITMSHVIEHLPDPVKIVQRLALLLKPNGLMMIATPHAESLGAKVFGSRWLYYLPDEHLHLFDAPSLQNVVEQAGLRVSDVQYYLWRKRSTLGAVARLALAAVRQLGSPNKQHVSSKDGIMVFAQKPRV